MRQKSKNLRLNKKELRNLIEITAVILVMLIGAFFLGKMSANKQKVVINNDKKKIYSSNFFVGNTYSAVYTLPGKSDKDPNVTHNVTIYFKNDSTMIEKDEQINTNQKTTEEVPNKITVYSATTEVNGNIVQGKTSSLVESKYNSHKKLKASLPYDVRARGQAFNYPLRDSDPTQFLFSINNDKLIAIMPDGHVINLVKSTQRLDTLNNYAKIFGKQRDRNDQASEEAKENSENNQNKLIQTQKNSDGVYFAFGYFSDDNDSKYTVDLKISNPTNKTQYITLEKVIFQGSYNKYSPNANYRGQIEIPAFSSKSFPAFFDQLKYDDIFCQFTIFYENDTNPIIQHQNSGKFPTNFREGPLENSGI